MRITLKKGFRAQFWSFDVLFAIVIFMAAITILALAWFNISNELALSNGGASYIMQLQSQAVAQNLVSAGSPADWQSIINPSSPATWGSIGAGLATLQGSQTLSPAKVYALQSMVNYNYSDAGPVLGTTYNYYIIINSSSFNITMGRNPTTNNAVTTFLNKKSAFINGVAAQITVFIWSGSVSSVS
jgi:hypothetical protein